MNTGGRCDIGGIVASAEEVNNCRFDGNIDAVAGASGTIGGIAGDTAISSTKVVKDCWNSGSIQVSFVGSAPAAFYVGGIVGQSRTSIQQCFNAGTVNALGLSSQNLLCSVGGIAGHQADSAITDCWNTRNVDAMAGTQDACAGGIVGELSGSPVVTRCYNTGTVGAATNTNHAYAGGIAGKQGAAHVSECWNTGTVDARVGGSAHAGGIAGSGYAIENCWNAGVVSAMTGSSDPGQWAYIGGISGYLSGSVQHCYSSGGLHSDNPGKAYIGGISGENSGSGAALTNAYYLNTAASAVGGVVPGTQTNANALDGDQLKDQGSFTGFDFASVWTMPADGYPVLRNNAAARYMVQYHANGGGVTGMPGAQTKYHDATLQLAGTVPTRAGYTFRGWRTDPNINPESILPPTQPVNYTQNTNATLYAIWLPNRVMMVFRPGNGGVLPSSRQYFYGTTFEPLPVPTHDGHVFDGWYTEPDGGVKVRSTDRMAFVETTYLYAHWTPAVYTMSFDSQGGIVSPAGKTVVYDEPYGALPTPTRTGYTFDAWYSAETGGYKRTENAVVKTTEDITLYARWIPNRYQITLDPDYEDGTPFDVTAVYDRTYEGVLVDFGQFGYTLVGWFTERNGGGVEYKPTDIVKLSSNITLYAYWMPANYTITFDSNGGEGTFPNKTVTFGQPHGELPVPTRPGYDFTGWFPHPVWGYVVKAEDIVKEWSDQTFYAHWKGAAHKVTLDAQGGTAPADMNVYFKETYRDLPTPVRTGHTFLGWYTEETGGTKVNLTDEVTTFEDETLYAQWQVNQYKVQFHPWGGTLDPETGSVKPQTKTINYGDPYNMPTPIYPGYEFQGWYLDSNSIAENKIEEGPVTIAKDHYLYALWKPGTYTITLDPMGGELDPSFHDTYGGKGHLFAEETGTGFELEATFEERIYVLPTLVRFGYHYMGWFTKPVGGEKIPQGDWSRFTENQTLYAQWEPLTCRAILVLDDKGNREYLPITFGEPYDLPTPTRTGYSFAGWYTARESGTEVKATDIVNKKDDHFIYALWTPNTYTVTFDAMDGEVSAESISVTYLQRYSGLPTPTRAGYTFLAWYTEPNGGRQINETSTVNTPEDHTLYAFWVAEMNNQVGHGSMKLNPRKTAKFEVNGITAAHYYSEDMSIASVDDHGNILAKRPGKVKIQLFSDVDMQIHYVDVQVKYTFLQWLAVIFLFGWIWIPIWW